jgi:two-component system, response regulator
MQMNSGAPLNILFIEDDPAHAEITMRNFKKNRIANNVTHLSDGQQALDYLFHENEYSDRESAPKPDLILMDLRLPKVDGLEVLQRIKSTDCLRKIPIVILTTSAAEKDISKAYDFNVNSYLVKPLDFKMFADLVETFGFYWVMWNKYPPCDEKS